MYCKIPTKTVSGLSFFLVSAHPGGLRAINWLLHYYCMMLHVHGLKAKGQLELSTQ